jgi:glucose-6-phosphate isomerase
MALVDQWYSANHCDRRRYMVAVTGANGGRLGMYADAHGLARFTVPEEVGGRFGVLSAVGLLPAALLGYDIGALLDGARHVRDASFAAGGTRDNGPLLAAAAQATLSEAYGKRTNVFMPYHSRLTGLGAWFVQLWSESLGKERRRSGLVRPAGQTTIAVQGPLAQHSQLQLYLDGPNDKVVTFVTVKRFETEIGLPDGCDYGQMGLEFLRGKQYADLIRAQVEGTRSALCLKQRPNATVTVDALSERELGALFMFFELQTAYAAEYLDVNAYDQPAIEIHKRATREALSG